MKNAFFLYLKYLIRRSKKKSAFKNDLRRYKQLDVASRFSVSKRDFVPCLDDNTVGTSFDAHYIYHPAWAARVVRKINPDLHIDISSALSFSTMLSAFVKTEFYDYRPAELMLDNLVSRHADLNDLPFESGSIASLSCMHTIEHIGLGRYGDEIDPEGDKKAISELKRVCADGGSLIVVVPIGRKRIQFNAHRIYAPVDMIALMDGFSLKEFSYVDDRRQLICNGDLEQAAQESYGCGCYWFVKEQL